MDEPHFAQVALSVADMAASLRFYAEGLGFRLAAGRYASGPGLAAIQGLAHPACVMWWLVTDQPFFQLELFQYASPKPHPRTDAWRACDIGYTRIGVSLPDVRKAVEAAEQVGARILARPEIVGGARRACVLDPTGIPVELVEASGSGGPRLVSLAASVPSIERARRYFVETLGLGVSAVSPVEEPRERLWGLDPAAGDRLVVTAGDVRLELVEYRQPIPAPRREGFQLNDHGVLNIALGYRDWGEFNAAYERATAAGYHAQTAPMGPGGVFDVSYCTDADGFSVELLYCPESSDEALGFVASTPLRR